MGWLADESATAIKHIARVVREDSGKYPTETDVAGFSYAELFGGSKRMPDKFRLPGSMRLNVKTASDEEIFNFVVKMTALYLQSLDYMRDLQGHYVGSPYDQFLRKNNLPLAPDVGEMPLAYSERLLAQIENLKGISYVTTKDNRFYLHKQAFVFGEHELAGMKTFFTSGKCIQCHSAPDFTDHLFHNTGVSQADYDQIHGAGSFMKLDVPNLAKRNAQADLFLPPTPENPFAKSLFRSAPSREDSRRADLGVWNVFANPAMPKPQSQLRTAICQSLEVNCDILSDDEILQLSLGMVKTPSVRDLGQSAPYLHTGQAEDLEGVVRLYQSYSAMARSGLVRNADPKLGQIQLTHEDQAGLAAFLRALNEDYQ
jgi:hypothetical protein